jgi:tRNA pseudouridine(38-40) synthase
LGWNYHGFTVQQDTEETIEVLTCLIRSLSLTHYEIPVMMSSLSIHMIQGYLFKALQKTRLIQDIKDTNYQRCGRTDRGVSAFGQVVSLFVRSRMNEGLGVVSSSNSLSNNNNNNNNNNNKSNSSDNKNKNEKQKEEIDYVQALNSVLPDDIRVISWCPVPLHFSARSFSLCLCLCLCLSLLFFLPDLMLVWRRNEKVNTEC